MASGQHQLQGGRVATQAPDLQAQRFPPARRGHEEAGPSRQTVTCPRRLAPGGRAEGRRPWKEQAGSLGEAPDTRRRAQSLPVTRSARPLRVGTRRPAGAGALRPASLHRRVSMAPVPTAGREPPDNIGSKPPFFSSNFLHDSKSMSFQRPLGGSVLGMARGHPDFMSSQGPW